MSGANGARNSSRDREPGGVHHGRIFGGGDCSGVARGPQGGFKAVEGASAPMVSSRAAGRPPRRDSRPGGVPGSGGRGSCPVGHGLAAVGVLDLTVGGRCTKKWSGWGPGPGSTSAGLDEVQAIERLSGGKSLS